MVGEGASGMNVNAPTQPNSGTMDVDEFMAFLETRPKGEHWDLIEGVAVMMASASPLHQRVARNLSELLNSAFAAHRLDMFAYLNIAVRTPGVRNFQPEPDVVVLPGLPGLDPYSEHFLLAAEILSPSNTRAEIDLKLRRYCEGPHNLYVLVIEPRKFFVQLYAKANNWQPATLTAPDESIAMPEFGLACQVIDLYRGTPLDPQRRAP
jgi:Uma2 family endonuclease